MRRPVLLAIMSLLSLVSCTHKELCYHHPHTARVRIDVDWSRFEKEVPTGMTVIAYDDDGNVVNSQLTNHIDHAYMALEAGTYHSIVYNQSPSEFGSVSFRGMDNYRTASVGAVPTVSRWYVSKAGEEKLATEPEWVAAGRQENSIVTPEMVNQTREHSINSTKTRSKENLEYVIAQHTPQNIIHTVYLTVHVNGIYNLRSARASLQGLAEGYVFHKDGPTENVVTQLLETWHMTQDKSDPTKGYITSRITCFGLPDGHSATPKENSFILSALLVDNKTILDFPFNVGDKFRKRVVGGEEQEKEYEIELWLEEPLPDVKPESGSSSGFDAVVKDWDEEIDHDINM